MVSSTFISSFLLAAMFATLVEAAPWPVYTKHATHRVREVGKRQLKVESYHPRSTFMTFGATSSLSPRHSKSHGNSSSFARFRSDFNKTAMAFISDELGVNTSSVAWRSGFTNDVGGVAYVKQSLNGIPFANAVANIAYKGEDVVSFGSSFIDTTSATVDDATPSLTWRSVLASVEESLEGSHNGIEPTLEYLAQADGSVALTHVIQIQNNETDVWYEAYVSAHTGELLSLNDFVADASYTVLPINKQAFPDGLETLNDPQNLAASPQGWHSTGGANSTTTSGNNALAFKGQARNGLTAQSSASLNFLSKYDDTLAPTNRANIAAATTNAFYIINTMHDVAYLYGFTESSFNFQTNNFGKGGRQNDPVMVSVQDASGTNNANFATPPDGQSGICRMFIWTLTNPNRDGTMENSIIIHEMTHGITNRLTGGGTGRCLQTVESGGLGEGWGDAMAEWMALKSATVNDFVMGQYVLGSTAGIRSFPYSTNAATNPLRYSSLQKFNEVHDIGEVWANMLHQVLAALVSERGFSADALTNPNGTEGNTVYMRLFIASLSLQPCNPTFVEARDAWIQADENIYNGANKCTLFTAFASRGLGLNASDVPAHPVRSSRTSEEHRMYVIPNRNANAAQFVGFIAGR